MSKPADAARRHWSDRLPERARGLAQLARWDRPIGWHLLWLPCVMGIALARVRDGFWPSDVVLVGLFLVGAVAMRGAGCTWNDVIDRKIDAQVVRTADRPIPSGRVGLAPTVIWLILQCLVGLGVLMLLTPTAQIVALASVPLVLIYPFMKRITWWPQVFLGLVFSWGVLVAGACIHDPQSWRGGFARLAISYDMLLLYAGCVFWVIAYDTIYALQDKDDDALIGVRSTARLFGARWRAWVTAFYAIALFLWSCAMIQAGANVWYVVPFAALGAIVSTWVIDVVEDDAAETALFAFRRNFWIGLIAAAILSAPAWVVTWPALLP
jgi:4-hydroxybenzoate polyprenyltransferase